MMIKGQDPDNIKRGNSFDNDGHSGMKFDYMLQTLDGTRVWKSRDAFQIALDEATRQSRLKLPAPIQKAILSALSERDEEADVCIDSKGNPEPDTDLRDYDNVLLKETIECYCEREVRPHVPDAWVDEDKTRVGYEIPFTRHFYEYKPLRPLEEIEAEIRSLEAEIQGMLGEVLG
jgi:type I restriction enzyme M protein